jgi:7,8-dihydropterin-6-yl-methyl-4-(beta-D-ribofuranosyl)aminobenzene 5'-phosphate synthase
VLSYLVAGLVGGAKPARAQALNGAAPEVDRLAVRVVTDSYHLALTPNLKVGEVEVQRFGVPPAGRSLLGEFGLAMHLESKRGDETRNLLLDFGFTPETFNNNIAMLGIAPQAIDALILSHGHYDHFGGLVGFLHQHRGQLRSELPLYLGGEECFCTRELIVGKPEAFGSLDRKALADANVKVMFAETPAVVAGHALPGPGIRVCGSHLRVVPTENGPVQLPRQWWVSAAPVHGTNATEPPRSADRFAGRSGGVVRAEASGSHPNWLVGPRSSRCQIGASDSSGAA